MSSTDAISDNDKKLADIYIKTYKRTEQDTKNIIDYEYKIYKNYYIMAIQTKEELENTPRILKNKRKELQQELEDLKQLANKHFKSYLNECEFLYDLHSNL